MILSHARLQTLAVPLTEPYSIAYNTFDSVTMHFLVLTTTEGWHGVGCAAPAEDVTGESANACRIGLEAWVQLAPGCDLQSLPRVPEGLPAAATAVDLALHDVLARSQGVTVGALFGSPHGAETPRETSITIGISDVATTLGRAAALVDQGFRFLKVKGGHDVETDLARLRALRDRFGSDIRLALDANQGYDLKAVERLESEASALDLAYLEQPTPKQDLPMLGEAAQRTGIPVMADESVQRLDDVARIAESGPVSLINIKLQKMGGLAPSAAIDRAAQAAGMRTMLGCMDESALSIAAALHFGASHPNVAFLDLDGHFDLSEDPMASCVRLDDRGRLATAPHAGLGWTDLPF
ncbi:MAG: dipeptide epimerase [Bacteroidetes bacterium]|nr:dipeptide epimerase [Bacteroidota bacterium]MDA0875014.1 dipeptide epimerase [Bacteroidota bacterium]